MIIDSYYTIQIGSSANRQWNHSSVLFDASLLKLSNTQHLTCLHYYRSVYMRIHTSTTHEYDSLLARLFGRLFVHFTCSVLGAWCMSRVHANVSVCVCVCIALVHRWAIDTDNNVNRLNNCIVQYAYRCYWWLVAATVVGCRIVLYRSVLVWCCWLCVTNRRERERLFWVHRLMYMCILVSFVPMRTHT